MIISDVQIGCSDEFQAWSSLSDHRILHWYGLLPEQIPETEHKSC